MHYILYTAIILVTFSLVAALTTKDRMLIAQVKEDADRVYNTQMRYALQNFIELDEAMINAQVLDEFRLRQIRSHKNEALSLLRLGTYTVDDLEAALQSFGRILLNPSKERLNAYTAGTLDDITNNNLRRVNREIRTFAYAANPKIRQLSDAAQQSEQELIGAFNNVAYAGLVEIEESFAKLITVFGKY